jgi:hypothetical protein
MLGTKASRVRELEADPVPYDYRPHRMAVAGGMLSSGLSYACRRPVGRMGPGGRGQADVFGLEVRLASAGKERL